MEEMEKPLMVYIDHIFFACDPLQTPFQIANNYRKGKFLWV